MDKGLEFAFSEFFNDQQNYRPDAKRVIIVITDGRSNNEEELEKIAKDLANNDIQVFAVGHQYAQPQRTPFRK